MTPEPNRVPAKHINRALVAAFVGVVAIASVMAGFLGGIGPAIFAGVLAAIGGGLVALAMRAR